jgi:integrase
MGLIRDRHGTYYAQRRVPERLQEAVARVLNSSKTRQVFLKKSLGTKALKAANVAATHVLADFDRTIAKAEALLAERPVISTLTDAQIKRMAESHYAEILADDEEARREGTGEPLFQSVAQQIRDAGEGARTPFAVGPLPEAGLSDREVRKRTETLESRLEIATKALARGDITIIQEHLDDLQNDFQLNVDRTSASYRKLGMAVLTAHVRAYKDLERRNAGEPIETPARALLSADAAPTVALGDQCGTLRDAFNGWKKERERPEGTVHEYGRAVDMFTQLHGDLRLVDMRRSHARLFRDALQQVPKLRKGDLLKAPLPVLSEYGRARPSIAKVSPATVNKQVGAVQAIAGWGHHHGLVPDEVSWANPFDEMRLEEELSDREPYTVEDLNSIFAHILTTKLPKAAKGTAGVWLPLLGLFSGGRLAELAGLRANDVREEDGCPLIWIVQDKAAGRRLKTRNAERAVPVHPQLVAMGFLDLVAERRRKDGENAWLLPSVSPDRGKALAAWSKWYGLYIREEVGLIDRRKVFHSFRHSFQDGLRRATKDEELRDAIAGRSSGKSVSRSYGAKSMLSRWGVEALREAVEGVSYPGLKLPRVRPGVHATSPKASSGEQGKDQ